MTAGATETASPWRGRGGRYWLEADADPDHAELLKNQLFGLLPWADGLLLSKPLPFCYCVSAAEHILSIRVCA